jgi:hypothetical protein
MLKQVISLEAQLQDSFFWDNSNRFHKLRVKMRQMDNNKTM